MKTARLLTLAAMALGAAALRAQTIAPSAGPASFALTGAVTVPYTLHWNASGISAEVGGLWNQRQFFGGEFSYYGGDLRTYDAYAGNSFVKRFRSRQKVDTAEVAYRYFLPLADLGGRAVQLYFGAGAGGGWVTYTNTGSTFGRSGASDTNVNPAAEVLAGVQVTAWRGLGLRLGYRYIDIFHVDRLNDYRDVSSGAIEAGLAFRF